ncbi:hypothetical protein [Dyella sp. ASV21]|uniref:hypothetical protein n=1 Tax=Dyella sp. ASV21 TaxID=2795114 RepID=UPI0018EDC6A0|nr:hypothetical protein [Dyella sp. ASV21]
MSHRITPLSLAQIHNVYAPTAKAPDPAPGEAEAVHYAKTSFSGREPGHPGHPPPRPESTGTRTRR